MKPNEAEALAKDFCEFINFQFQQDPTDHRDVTRFLALGLKVGAIDLDWSGHGKRGSSPGHPASQDEQFRRLRVCHEQIVSFVDWLFVHSKEHLVLEVETRKDFSWKGGFSFEIQYPGMSDKTVKATAHDAGGAMRGRSVKTFDLPSCLVNFLTALNGRPASALRRCAWCKKVFFNSSQREKSYCNPRCQNSAAVARSRGKKEG